MDYERRRIYTIINSAHKTPCFQTTGSWLEAYGFPIGTKVEVLPCDKMLIITKIPDYLDLDEDYKRINRITRLREELSSFDNA